MMTCCGWCRQSVCSREGYSTHQTAAVSYLYDVRPRDTGHWVFSEDSTVSLICYQE